MEPNQIEELKAKACEAIDHAAGELHSISKQIWENPETAYKEYKAHKLLTDYLENKGFDVQRSYVTETGFAAKPKENASERKPNIAILCEYDALPGVDHGCGHNLIAEVGIAASLGIQKALQSAGFKYGQLSVLGTPAEEEGGGKVDFIRAGAFKDIDVALMSHPGRFSCPIANALAMTEVHVEYKGKASHASGFPWEGVNALDAAVMAYTNMSCMRQQMRPAWRVHGIITRGGVAPNVIPEEAELFYYLRAPTVTQLNQLIEKAKGCFEGAAVATGCEVSYKWDPKPYENVVNIQTLLDLYEANGNKLGAPFVQDPALKSMFTGSTDMGNVSHIVPGIHPHFQINSKDPAHTLGFAAAAGAPEAQVSALREGKMLAMTAIDIYCQPEKLKAIKQEFQDALNKEQQE